MSEEHLELDAVLTSIVNLRSHDVNASRANRLRSRCHSVLEKHQRQSLVARASVRRAVIPAVASAWCLLYVCEILLRAAAVYGF